MKVAILGRTQMLLNTMDVLLAKGHSVVLIGTCTAAGSSAAKEDAFEERARALGVPYFNNVKLHDPKIFAMLKDCDADIGVSLNWMSLITADVRELFPQGVLNAHAGDLPRYRGNATPNWAILNAEKTVTFCIHEMADALDAGAVYARRSMELTEGTRVGQIYDWMEQAIPQAYGQVLDAIEKTHLEPIAQPTDPSLALRCYPRLPEDNQIDWNQRAENLARLVNASSEPFSGAFSYIDGQRITVWRAYAQAYPCPSFAMPGQVLAIDRAQGTVSVATGDGALVLSSISVGEQGQRMSPTEQIRSLRVRFHGEGWIPHTPCFR